jgi:hypothetical protein
MSSAAHNSSAHLSTATHCAGRTLFRLPLLGRLPAAFHAISENKFLIFSKISSFISSIVKLSTLPFFSDANAFFMSPDPRAASKQENWHPISDYFRSPLQRYQPRIPGPSIPFYIKTATWSNGYSVALKHTDVFLLDLRNWTPFFLAFVSLAFAIELLR